MNCMKHWGSVELKSALMGAKIERKKVDNHLSEWQAGMLQVAAATLTSAVLRRVHFYPLSHFLN